MNIDKRLIFISLILSTVFQNCGDSTEPLSPVYNPQINVFGLLSPDPQLTFVRVERTFRIDVAMDMQKGLIDNADVEISWSAGIIKLIFDGDNGYYRDPNLNFSAAHEMEYQLSVSAPGFNELKASTVVPGDFSILRPVNGDTVNGIDKVEIKWSKSEKSEIYFHQIFVVELKDIEDPEIYGIITSQSFVKDTSLTIFPFFGGYAFPVEGRYRIKIAACDRNYYDYFRTGKSEDQKDLEHLSGGHGLLGSVVIDSVDIYAVRREIRVK
ncbi:MAG: DUF4249 family protein [Fidelibacterota bacterium]